LKHRSALVTAVVAAVVVATGGVLLRSGVGSAAEFTPQASSAGCGKAPALSDGTHTIQSGGQNRSYILRLPTNYNNNQAYRLVFSFHWVGGTAEQVDNGSTSGIQWSYYGLRVDQYGKGNTIFVAPQGISNGWGNSGGQDITFVDNMIKTIEAGLCVDTTELFASGFSYGASMTYALACARATVFRGVIVYSGGVLSGCDGGNQPIAYFGIHGLRDTTLPISGGRSMRDRFVGNNGCTRQNPPEPAQGSLTHVVTWYSGCKAGYPVVWGAFDGPHAPNAVDGSADPYAPGAKSWTQAEVWKFITSLGTSTSQPPTTPPATTPVNPPVTTPPRTTPPVTTPPVTTPPVTTPPVTTPPVTGACTATYRTVNSWNGGFQGEIGVTAGSSALNGWTLSWTAASGQTITQVWNGTLTTSGSTITVHNASYNGSIPAGGTLAQPVGFLGNGTPSTPSVTCINS
jgi:poly(3-hydroxybutyrate) depolymerase